ncbi:MAG: hypothetical protein AAF415_09000 [Pseudomonadota bacterium]
MPIGFGAGEDVCDPGLRQALRSGAPWAMATRALRRAVQPRDRVLALDAGIGVLPAIAARVGAERVIAFEGNPHSAALMRDLFRANGSNAEAIHGIAHDSAFAASSEAAAAYPEEDAPKFDLPLILGEEKITTLILLAPRADRYPLHALPDHLEQVLLTSDIAGATDATFDLAIVKLIGSGFSYDAAASEGSALLLRRR